MSELSAKEIYFENGCNHFHITREGLWEEYLRLGGNNKKTEKKWRLEYIDYWYKRIPEDEFTSFLMLANIKPIEILDNLLTYELLPDDYTKFWFASMLLDISKDLSFLFYSQKAILKKKATEILEKILAKEIHILPKNRSSISDDMLFAFQVKTPEEYLKAYSNRLLKPKKKTYKTAPTRCMPNRANRDKLKVLFFEQATPKQSFDVY